MSWNNSTEFSTSPQQSVLHNFPSFYSCCYHIWKMHPWRQQKSLWTVIHSVPAAIKALSRDTTYSLEFCNSLCVKCFIIYKKDMGSRKKLTHYKVGPSPSDIQRQPRVNRLHFVSPGKCCRRLVLQREEQQFVTMFVSGRSFCPNHQCRLEAEDSNTKPTLDTFFPNSWNQNEYISTLLSEQTHSGWKLMAEGKYPPCSPSSNRRETFPPKAGSFVSGNIYTLVIFRLGKEMSIT